MNLPNLLTLSRIGFAVVLVVILQEQTLSGNILALVIFTIASLTDFYDGYLAKTRGLISDFGKIMDPIADKVLLLSVFGVLASIGRLSWWVFIIITFREVAVTISRLLAMREGRVIAAERTGKIKTVIQMTSVFVILFYLIAEKSQALWFYNYQKSWSQVNEALILLAVVMTVYSGIDYFRHHLPRSSK